MKDHMNATMSQELKDWYASASNGRQELRDEKAQAQFGNCKTAGSPPSSDSQGSYYDGPFGGRMPGGK